MSAAVPKPAPPCAVVIFGAGGDLAKRKLLPALFNLRRQGQLPDEFALVEAFHRETDPAEARRRLGKNLEQFVPKETFDPALRDWFVERAEQVAGELTDDTLYARLREKLGAIAKSRRTEGNVLFYLATPPALFGAIPKKLGKAGLLVEGEKTGWRRVIIEKPFGDSFESARDLNHELSTVLEEDQIFRIDHYLGKETVQNIMVLRFANGLYEPVWNNRYIDSVQFTVAETLGVETRGDYYDGSGALRDMVPNHLFQLVALIGMEPPNSFAADDVRDERAKLVRAIRPFTEETIRSQVVRGQYGAGSVGGETAPAYRNEPKVKPDSGTETFLAMKLEIDNWRWAGVPFYLRTGKRMASHLTEVVIRFRCAPMQMFREEPCGPLQENLLVLQIQPEERIQTRFTVKVPGTRMELSEAIMDFNYVDRFGTAAQTGYETLLYECMKGDATLFQRADQIEAGWSIVAPILQAWKKQPAREFPNYAAGSWGPPQAAELLARDGRQWTAINCTDAACYFGPKRAA